MTTIKYYDMSGTRPLSSITTGKSVAIDELVQEALTERRSPPEEILKLSNITESNVDPLGIKRPARWESLMSLIIWSLSNRVPSRQEVLRGRQILMSLPKHIKKSDQFAQLVFALLPYMLIGFKSHTEDRFQADSNRINSITAFVDKLSTAESPVFESFLCAHRGKGGAEKFYLVDDVHQAKAAVALNLSKGILANNPWSTGGSIRWFQQGPTEFASLNMFPEMFLRYLQSGEVSLLLSKLERHLSQIQHLDRVVSDGIGFEAKGSDARSHKVLGFLIDTYGPNWRSTDFTSSAYRNDLLVQTAIEKTLPLMLRQMPFYTSPEVYKDFSERKQALISLNRSQSTNDWGVDRSDLVSEAIERFYAMQSMHPTAKAVYESAFYYLWGITAEETGVFSVGIDRDHAEFQNQAWDLGAKAVRGLPPQEAISSSLLYARRNPGKETSDHLRDLSVRQFWR